jgi:SSS family solute:Na+ symporter
MNLTLAHWVGLLLTLAAVTFMGVSAARKVKNAADFTLGGQKSGTALVTGTIVGTIIGGASTVGTAQLAFSVGLSAWWFTLGAGIALTIMAVWYAGPLRRSGYSTLPQLLSNEYGEKAGPLTGTAASIGIFFSIVANILSAVPLVSVIFGISPMLATLITGILILVYVCFGGVWGTGMVGILKLALIYLTLIAAAWISFIGMDRLGGFFSVFPSEPWFDLFGRGLWVDAASGLSLVVGTLTTQTYLQALFASRDEKTARNGALVAAIVTLPSGIPAIMAGLFMRANHPNISPIDALPLFIINYFPPWLGGVAIAALLLAAVGSAAGLALGVGTMLSRDFLKHRSAALTESAQLLLNRVMVFAVTAAALVFTFGNLRTLVLEWNFLSMGLRGAGTFFPLTAALFLPGRISGRAALASMLAGTLVAFLWKFVFPAGLDPLYPGLVSSLIILALGFKPHRGG